LDFTGYPSQENYLGSGSFLYLTCYTPYIGFIFAGEPRRGNKISERLCLAAFNYAKSVGFDRVYLVSDHINLYEKYGFVEIDRKEAPWGAMQTIFCRTSQENL